MFRLITCYLIIKPSHGPFLQIQIVGSNLFKGLIHRLHKQIFTSPPPIHTNIYKSNFNKFAIVIGIDHKQADMDNHLNETSFIRKFPKSTIISLLRKSKWWGKLRLLICRCMEVVLIVGNARPIYVKQRNDFNILKCRLIAAVIICV